MPQFRTEHDSMGEVRVPADALWRAQTQRAVENFPSAATPIEPALIHAIGRAAAAAATVNGELGIRRDRPPAIVAAARGRRGRARCRVPRRRLPDRVGDQLQHERQRGHRDSPSVPGPTSTPTTTSTPASRATTPSRRRIHVAATLAVVGRPPARRSTSRWQPRRKAEEFADLVKSGPHPPDGRDAGDARPGARWVRRHGAVRRGAARVGPAPGPRAPAGGTAVGTGINTPAGSPSA